MKVALKYIVEKGLRYPALVFACPGCASMDGNDGLHILPINTTQKQPSWDWNNDLDLPTISPSILTRNGRGGICHSFLKDGVFEFLSDSTHSFAGQNVPIGHLPSYMIRSIRE